MHFELVCHIGVRVKGQVTQRDHGDAATHDSVFYDYDGTLKRFEPEVRFKGLLILYDTRRRRVHRVYYCRRVKFKSKHPANFFSSQSWEAEVRSPTPWWVVSCLYSPRKH